MATSLLKTLPSSGPAPPVDAGYSNAIMEAREEIREVMLQYTSCADPTESAARKERMRLAEKKEKLRKLLEIWLQQTPPLMHLS